MFPYLIIIAITLIVVYSKWRYNYWQRLGFPYVKAQIPFGVLDPVIRTWQKSLGMAIYDIYKQSNDKVVGIYLINRPALLVRDAKLSHDLLTKDFASFHDRGVYVDEEHDPMSGGLFFLKGEKWKNLRTKLAPSFTSGKLKGMFSTIENVSHKMVHHIRTQLPEDGSPATVEAKHIFATYSIDIIASSIFGLDVDSFNNPQNEFFAVSKNINEKTYLSVFRGTCQFLFPGLEKLFQRLGWTEEAPERMKDLVRRTVDYREKNNVTRKDMLQLLLQLRNTGKINDDSDEEWSVLKTKDALTNMSVEMIAAQLFLFYIAGFETSASTTAFTLYELAQHPELLKKAQNDVEQAFEKYGKLSYEALNEMKFLDLCIMETTRKYPGLPILNRECTHDYAIPDLNLVIQKGTPIIISLFGIHRDAEYFPNPMLYDPERFLEQNMNYDPIAFMPFGEGPRHCIAQRMGKINVKTAIFQILTNFNVEVCPTVQEIEIDNFGIPIMPKGGIPIKLSRKI